MPHSNASLARFVSLALFVLLTCPAFAGGDVVINSVLLDLNATAASDNDALASNTPGSEMVMALFDVGPGDTYEAAADATVALVGNTLTVSAGTSTASGVGMLPVGFEDVFSSATASVDFQLDGPHVLGGGALGSQAGLGADWDLEFIDLLDDSPVGAPGVLGPGTYRLTITSDAEIVSGQGANLAAGTRILTFTAVPEPASAMILLPMAFMIMIRRARIPERQPSIAQPACD